MTPIDAIILGIVEGLTEFLPVSSTGHLILSAHLLNLSRTDFLDSFEIVIQLGAILAVVVLHWRRFFLDFEFLKRIFVAFAPTAVAGLLLYKVIKRLFFGNQMVVLWSLFLGGIFLILFEIWHREDKSAEEDISRLSYKKCVWIGLFQTISFIPGVSRAAATIVGGLLVGLKRRTVVEFSFLLAVPTMAAATGLELFKNYQSFSADQFGILATGFLTSFFVAIIGIKFLIYFINRHRFTWFGVYRILTALFFWFVLSR